MIKLEKIKRQIKDLGLDIDTVLYNMRDLQHYRYINNVLYYSPVVIGGKVQFAKEFRKEVNLKDYV